jgi:hypothetical protein
VPTQNSLRASHHIRAYLRVFLPIVSMTRISTYSHQSGGTSGRAPNRETLPIPFLPWCCRAWDLKALSRRLALGWPCALRGCSALDGARLKQRSSHTVIALHLPCKVLAVAASELES